ncbi:methylthioribose-1-phosphate isomerase [Methylobacillus rhizosphaerae]|uniref:Methylthioribose-1-phosphate isomerase n=1 Tax=Methylobacillus rhizosphaerae TaxID=551994 RepID=A0A239AP84_9PROT|nr:S-methyl-5-thioribose-1-phosphate isomerase [Methylobacillus rhizosphaerae]SNR97151.1 methylthioribose-1-phosphate isomerase [Methylobacillus rhizosphaerae]
MKIGKQSWRTIWAGQPASGSMLPQQVCIIDQTGLPHQFRVVEIDSVRQMAEAIRNMQVRGAPLIGAAAAYGMALASLESDDEKHLQESARLLLASRPTAVNLRWALERMLERLLPVSPHLRCEYAWREAGCIADEDVVINHAIGQQGLNLLRELARGKSRRLNILTHCNAGWLATVDWGTALAPVYAAFDAGMDVHVWVDETRPRNQGASLTAWELAQHGIPFTVICDNAGGHLMQHGQVDCVIVGADRVTRTGDVCNKIGTYLKALAAFDNQIPFYVAVPTPTIDWRIESGVRDIPIEERDPREVTTISGLADDGTVRTLSLTPAGSMAANPAFDVTPARLVTGIITEHGCVTPNDLIRIHQEMKE